MAKKYKYTLGIDPSGAYKEGKGTTGWCLLNNKNNKLTAVGTIKASDYESAHLYYRKHLLMIDQLNKKYKGMAVSIEDYILYRASAMAQVNSQLETVQLLGIIKYFCKEHDIPLFIRPAVAVKKRWADDILVYKGVILKVGARYMLPNKHQVICEHERDSIRHALHFNTFENKEVT